MEHGKKIRPGVRGCQGKRRPYIAIAFLDKSVALKWKSVDETIVTCFSDGGSLKTRNNGILLGIEV